MNIISTDITIPSKHLAREVKITLLFPATTINSLAHHKVLLLNDGQDIPALKLEQTLKKLYQQKNISPIVVVGIHADENRLQEYGTAAQADYMGRGSLAKNFTQFILKELLPYLKNVKKIDTDTSNLVYAGFSLGGLSSLDIVWENPQYFGKVGVFSGSLWWRQKSTEAGYTDENDRIMHNLVKAGSFQKHLQFWFEAGTEDEKDDRNNNGIIDAIDDTLDLIKLLKIKGYTDQQIKYEEVQGGKHNQETWSKIMPEFLKWAFNTE